MRGGGNLEPAENAEQRVSPAWANRWLTQHWQTRSYLCHVWQTHSYLPLEPALLPLQRRNTGQGTHLKAFGHLGWWKPWFCLDLCQVWVSLGIPWVSLLVLPSVNVSLAQFVVLKQVNVQNASCGCWGWSPSPGLPSWGGQEPRLCAAYGPKTPAWGSHPLFPTNASLQASPCRAVLWATNTASALAVACLLQRISWCFQETESKLKCSSALKED